MSDDLKKRTSTSGPGKDSEADAIRRREEAACNRVWQLLEYHTESEDLDEESAESWTGLLEKTHSFIDSFLRDRREMDETETEMLNLVGQMFADAHDDLRDCLNIWRTFSQPRIEKIMHISSFCLRKPLSTFFILVLVRGFSCFRFHFSLASK